MTEKTEFKSNYLIQVLRDLHAGTKPKVLSGGLFMRRYEFHGMSELVVWRENGVEPSAKELEIIEESLRILCAPDFVARTADYERSGQNFAYRFFWPQKKGKIKILTVQMRMQLAV